MNDNGKLTEVHQPEVLPREIWLQHQGKCIIFSEDEQRVIGVGDTWEEANQQAEASGVKGLWHFHLAAVVGEGIV